MEIKSILALQLFLVAGLAFSFTGDLDKAPPNFSHFDDSYVFVDMKKIVYEVTYDVSTKTASATSHLYFETNESGRPIFDLKPSVSEIYIDGTKVNALDVPFPKKESWARSIDQDVSAGEHHMVIKSVIKKNVRFSSGSVKSAFWLSDLEDRSFIEEYLPTNLEYDQMEITIDLGMKNTTVEHTLYSNYESSEENGERTLYHYPAHFTASSLFFHLVPEGSFSEKKGTYTSIDGRQIPITAYGKWPISVTNFYNNSISTLKELEGDYGPFPHDQLIVYATFSGGGMEYCGATITAAFALEHEIAHSYFARGIKPINGNSGWIDEAIVSWRDDGYKSFAKLSVFSANMASRSVYRRKTDRAAYTDGARFMGHLNYLLSSHGGLKAFLDDLTTNHMFTSISNEFFITALNDFTKEDFRPLFEKYIFKTKTHRTTESKTVNPYHPPLTEEFLNSLL